MTGRSCRSITLPVSSAFTGIRHPYHLVGEAQFLSSFDAAYQALDRSIDLPSPLLHKLIIMCQTHGGTISKHRRKQFKDTVPPEYFDEIEMVVAEAFGFPAPHSGGG